MFQGHKQLMTSKKLIRRNFGKEEKNLPEINLSQVQKESWQWFLGEGIKEELIAISPIEDFTGKNWQLIFGGSLLGRTDNFSKNSPEKRNHLLPLR